MKIKYFLACFEVEFLCYFLWFRGTRTPKKFGIRRNSVKKFVVQFLKSGAYVGLIRNGPHKLPCLSKFRLQFLSVLGFLSTLASAEPHKMVFVVNMSLKMRAGKIAAQVGHATLGVYRLAQRSDKGQQALTAWRSVGEMKVVVKGDSTDHLLELFKESRDKGLFVYVVSDAGRTQIPAGSRTVLGIFGPSETVDSVSGKLKLL
ncbi:unnamed protein product [Enterobius vermicularis]|uniref:peptidyl-tRNA hydrolase n=1 Tax=Enterobius vermicularis TaxID=51028 RepID=A0A3P6H505_ENTVE|nr:unnamed protein product [Enterobius vermicularis]